VSVLDNFEEWKDFLHNRVDQAESLGIGRDNINQIAYRVGNFLVNNVNPRNTQERVLKDLWSVADEDQQKVLGELMVKLVENE
jgi:hypothetical protein